MVSDQIKDTLLIGYRQQIASMDSINKVLQEGLQLQLRNLARLEAIVESKDKLLSLYEANEKDLRKQLKRSRTATTLTGLAGIVLTVVVAVLVK